VRASAEVFDVHGGLEQVSSIATDKDLHITVVSSDWSISNPKDPSGKLEMSSIAFPASPSVALIVSDVLFLSSISGTWPTHGGIWHAVTLRNTAIDEHQASG
jgi:hypothetical protein